jgi:aryl-alcohol dehydrogenase-like predicted oxidoreductase
MGRTGLEVTPVGFGSQTIGGLGYGDQDWDESLPTALAYLKGGGRFIDTARGYGVSEIYVGKALRKFPKADEVVVCSKSGSMHPPVIRSDLDTSLYCVGRDRLDLYTVHVPPPSLDHLKKMLDAYQRFREQGKIRFIGVSNRGLSTSAERDEALKIMEDERIDVLQFPYSFARPEVAPLIAEARKRGKGVVVRQALEGGMFTDKFRPGHRFTDRDNDWRAGVAPDDMEKALRLIEEIRKRFVKPPYRTLSNVALAFVLSDPNVCATIPGAGSVAEMKENLSANDAPPLTAAAAAELMEMARPIVGLLRPKRK